MKIFVALGQYFTKSGPVKIAVQGKNQQEALKGYQEQHPLAGNPESLVKVKDKPAAKEVINKFLKDK